MDRSEGGRSDTNTLDSLAVQASFNATMSDLAGASPSYRADADFDQDGVVNSFELLEVLGNFNTSVPSDRLSTEANVVGYAGYVFEPSTGLYCVRFRWYEPGQGRWLKRDPLGYVDGQSVYEYARSDPVLKQDPMGLHARQPRRDFTTVVTSAEDCAPAQVSNLSLQLVGEPMFLFDGEPIALQIKLAGRNTGQIRGMLRGESLEGGTIRIPLGRRLKGWRTRKELHHITWQPGTEGLCKQRIKISFMCYQECRICERGHMGAYGERWDSQQDKRGHSIAWHRDHGRHDICLKFDMEIDVPGRGVAGGAPHWWETRGGQFRSSTLNCHIDYDNLKRSIRRACARDGVVQQAVFHKERSSAPPWQKPRDAEWWNQ